VSSVKIVKVDEADTVPNSHGVDARKIHSIEHVEVIHITLNLGEKLKKHATPVDVFFYVLVLGEGIIEIGGEREEVGPDTLIESPAKIPHCWCNESDKVLRFLVVKTPRQTQPTKVLGQ